MLLSDRHLAGRPAVPQQMQVRQEHFLHRRFEGQRRKHAIEHAIRPLIVEAIQRLAELVGETHRRRRRIGFHPSRITSGDEGAAGCLRGGQPLRDQGLRTGDASLVLVGVQTEPAVRT